MSKQQRKKEIIVRININYRIIFGLAHPMISHGPWPEEATHLGVARSILHRYFFLTRSQVRDVVLWIAIKRRLSVKCVIGLNIDIMRRNHPKLYTNGCCTMNLQFTAQNYKTTGIPFPFTWELLPEDLFAKRNPAEKRELGDRKYVSMNNRIAPLNYQLRARKCPIKCDWLSTISELELNREPGVIHASQKKVIIRSHRPWPLRTIYTTKSLSLKTCHSPIPVTKKWAWKRLLPFFLVPSLCRRITDDWKNRSTWLFSVYERSGRFLCSKKKLLSFR